MNNFRGYACILTMIAKKNLERRAFQVWAGVKPVTGLCDTNAALSLT